MSNDVINSLRERNRFLTDMNDGLLKSMLAQSMEINNYDLLVLDTMAYKDALKMIRDLIDKYYCGGDIEVTILDIHKLTNKALGDYSGKS